MRRILVVRAGALGDTLMATPVLRALRNEYTGSEIDFLSSASAAPLLAANPHIRRLFTLAQRNVPFAFSPEKWRLAALLRARRYDLVVLLESSPVFERLVRLAGARRVVTFRDIAFDPAEHSIVNNLRVAGFSDAASTRNRLFRASVDTPRELDMELGVAEQDQQTVERWLEIAPPGSRLIGMHAGYGPASRKQKNQTERLKGWEAANFATLARSLVDLGFTIVFTGSADDRNDAERITSELPGRFFQFAGRTTVGQLAAVIRQCELFISVDSGPAHMAAALAVPLVVLWGPARLEQVRPLSSRSPVRVVRHAVSCAPCYDTPMMKTCRRNICMQAISPQRVLREALMLVEAPVPAAEAQAAKGHARG